MNLMILDAYKLRLLYYNEHNAEKCRKVPKNAKDCRRKPKVSIGYTLDRKGPIMDLLKAIRLGENKKS